MKTMKKLNEEELEITIMVLSKVLHSMKKDDSSDYYTDEGNITLMLNQDQLLNLYSTAKKLVEEYKK